MISKPLLPGKTDHEQLVLISKLLGSPSPSIWPEIVELPLYSDIKLPVTSYDSINSTFNKYSDLTLALLKSFLIYRPCRRITAQQALDHAYFSEHPKACSKILLPTYRELRNEPHEKSKTIEIVHKDKKPSIARSSKTQYMLSSSSILELEEQQFRFSKE